MHRSAPDQHAVRAIRLWSGPNNIAALVREAFVQRGDCSLAATPDGQPLWLQVPALANLSWVGADWGDGEQHILLIRDPHAQIADLQLTHPHLCAEDLGLPQLNRLFERVVDRSGLPPVVIDAEGFLASPQAHLRALCHHLGIDFRECMANRQGERDWQDWRLRLGLPPPSETGRAVSELLSECLPMYWRLYQHRLQPEPSTA